MCVSMFADSLSGGDFFVARDLLALGAFAFLQNRPDVTRGSVFAIFDYEIETPRVSLEVPIRQARRVTDLPFFLLCALLFDLFQLAEELGRLVLIIVVIVVVRVVVVLVGIAHVECLALALVLLGAGAVLVVVLLVVVVIVGIVLVEVRHLLKHLSPLRGALTLGAVLAARSRRFGRTVGEGEEFLVLDVAALALGFAVRGVALCLEEFELEVPAGVFVFRALSRLSSQTRAGTARFSWVPCAARKEGPRRGAPGGT